MNGACKTLFALSACGSITFLARSAAMYHLHMFIFVCLFFPPLLGLMSSLLHPFYSFSLFILFCMWLSTFFLFLLHSRKSTPYKLHHVPFYPSALSLAASKDNPAACHLLLSEYMPCEAKNWKSGWLTWSSFSQVSAARMREIASWDSLMTPCCAHMDPFNL